MDASLLALGITLFVAAIVPVTYGRYTRGAGLAYLATMAWGAGAGWTIGLIFLASSLMACLVLGGAGAMRLAHTLGARNARGA